MLFMTPSVMSVPSLVCPRLWVQWGITLEAAPALGNSGIHSGHWVKMATFWVLGLVTFIIFPVSQPFFLIFLKKLYL